MGTELQDQIDRERWERHMATKRWMQAQPTVEGPEDEDELGGAALGDRGRGMSPFNRVMWLFFVVTASVMVWRGHWDRATFAVSVVVLLEVRAALRVTEDVR